VFSRHPGRRINRPNGPPNRVYQAENVGFPEGRKNYELSKIQKEVDEINTRSLRLLQWKQQQSKYIRKLDAELHSKIIKISGKPKVHESCNSVMAKLSYIMAKSAFSTQHNNAEEFESFEKKAQELLDGITEVKGENGLEFKCG